MPDLRASPRAVATSEWHTRAEESFLQVFRQSITDGIEALLGKNTLSVLVDIYHVESLGAVPSRLHERLGEIFGNGAQILERIILKDFCRRANLFPNDIDMTNFNFDRCVNQVRQLYFSTRP